MTCEAVEAAWRGYIARFGLEKASRIGYSVGLGYPPDWGEHTMSLRPGDTTELEPGMAFHMICGMWMDDWGFEASETFVVTDVGRGVPGLVPARADRQGVRCRQRDQRVGAGGGDHLVDATDSSGRCAWPTTLPGPSTTVGMPVSRIR